LYLIAIKETGFIFLLSIQAVYCFKERLRRYGRHSASKLHPFFHPEATRHEGCITSELPKHAGEKAQGRVIVAHLGNGTSLCAMRNLDQYDSPVTAAN
jgi:acetate kinase